MAKDKKDSKGKTSEKKGDEFDDDDEDSISSKIIMFLVGMVIVAIWLAIFGLIIKMDVGGFGSTVLYPVLKDVPVLNKILPEVYYADQDYAYQFETVDEAVVRIKELEVQLEAMRQSGSANGTYISELETQSKELAIYKQNEAEFEKNKEKFYEEVVFSDYAPDISEYKKYYESIEPANASAIYKQVVEQTERDAEIDEYAKTYASMKPAAAAAVFDTMTDDLALVGKILWSMEAGDRAKILDKMDSKTAALVTKLMEP